MYIRQHQSPVEINPTQSEVKKKKKLKLATIVEGDPKAPLLIATTPMCRGGCYSFPRIDHFTLDL